ncbi:fibronectin type III domain-containing protein, partial [Okibacterium endophyticum]
AYWYTSGGSRDPAKPANPLTVSYTAEVVSAPTAIVTQPQDVETTLGETAALSVEATGDGLSYQWQKSANGTDWTDIDGATEARCKIVATTAAAAQYRVVVTGASGSVSSESATLAVSVPTPTVVVSKTEGIDPDGETLTITGSGFLPNPPATSGSRPPLAGKFTGAYIAFGKFADVWKPSAGAGSATRDTHSVVWGVHQADLVTIDPSGSGAGVAIGEDGTFEATLQVEKGYDGEPETGNYGIYTYPGGGAAYPAFETYTPVAFAVLAPEAPAKPTATLSGDAEVTVSWTAPSGNGEAITGYDVTLTPANGEPSTQSVPADATEATFDGLVPGVSYTATVVARNAGGPSPVSDASDAVTVPATAPAAPAQPTVSAAGSDSINVSWAAPADGGSPITGYTVSVAQKGSGIASVSATETTAVVTGLDRATEYTVTVTAENAVGESSASPAATVTTLAEVPGSLAAPTVSAVSGSEIAVAWAPASDDGGSPVTGYLVTIFHAGERVASAEAVASASSVTVSGLTPGAEYTATVAAVNAAGTGQPSPVSAPISTFDVPGAPRPVTATATGTSVDVTWGVPDDDGGTPLTSYAVVVFSSGSPVQQKTVDADATSVSFDNLVPGATYTVSVIAYNTVGGSSGVSTDVTVPATAPGVPGTPVAQLSDGDAVTVSWTAPAVDGGSAITGYDVVLTGDDGELTESVDASTLSVVFDGLAAGDYTAVVTAKNAAGQTSSEESGAVSVPGAAPEGEPELLTEFPDESYGGVEVTVDGTTATVTAGAEYAGTWIGLSLHSEPVFLGWFLADAAGTVTVQLPADLEAGAHRLVAYAADGTVIGYNTFEVAAAPSTGTPVDQASPAGSTAPAGPGSGLADTGADISGWAAAALVLLLLGAGAVVYTRTRRTSIESE